MPQMYGSLEIARLYNQYRPSPPTAVINRVLEFVRRTASLGRAVDVGCGTGQNTRLLAPHFTSVLATDISPAQVAVAIESNPHDGVRYEIAPAEEIAAPDGSVDLVTASACYHYFDAPRFLAEADRVLAPGGVLALYFYRVFRPHLEDGSVWTEYDSVLSNLLHVRLVDYWQLPLKDAMGVHKEAMQLIQYSDVVWDEESYFVERPLSVEQDLGEIRTFTSFHNMVRSCGAEQGEALLQEVRKELLSVIADGEKRGINIAAVTMRQPCFLMMARKPVGKATSG